MEHSEAVEAYNALSFLLRDFEKNLEEGEDILISGNGPNARQFFVHTIQRVRNLIMLVGDDDDGQLHELIFAANQISIQISSHRRDGPRKPIGFIAE